MIAPIIQMFGKKTIKLLPQEKEGNYKFNGQFIATAAALEKFGEAVIIAAHIMLLKQVKQQKGLDYLQVFEIDSEKLWFIDDVTHVTCLLPNDY
jgi:hypothetical protein